MNTSIRHIILFLLLIISQHGVKAQTDTVLVEHHSVWNTLLEDTWHNPALHGQAFSTSLTQVMLTADYRHQTDAFVVQKGTGHVFYDLSADAFLRLSDNTAVWGRAQYLTGKCWNICWNSVSDYDLLEPYILADTLGGDTERERYVFEGGYATSLGKWNLGGELLFRADHEYRTTDPRMRSIVTDLTIRAGAAYDAYGYHWALDGEANVYKQTNNVSFYRETGVIPEYQMTGLGAVNIRFSGEVNNMYFNGGGTAVSLSATPDDRQGLFANAVWSQHRYERIAASLNSLPLTTLYANRLIGQIGWRHSRRNDWMLLAAVDYQRRLGDENIVGSGASSIYPVLTTLTMYKHHLLDASLQAVYGRRGSTDWHLSLRGGYLSNAEKYMEPSRKLEYSRVYGRIDGQILASPVHRLTLDCRLHGAYYKQVANEMSIPLANTDATLANMLAHNFDYLKADYSTFGASVRGDWHFDKSRRYAAFTQLSADAVMTSVDGSEVGLNCSIGITF